MNFDTYLESLSLAEVKALRQKVEQRYVALKIADRQAELQRNAEEIQQLLVALKAHRQSCRAIKLIRRMGYCITNQTLNLPGYSCVPVVVETKMNKTDQVYLQAGYRLHQTIGKTGSGPTKKLHWANLYYALKKEPADHLRIIQCGGWEQWNRREDSYYNEAGEPVYDMAKWPVDFPFIVPE